MTVHRDLTPKQTHYYEQPGQPPQPEPCFPPAKFSVAETLLLLDKKIDVAHGELEELEARLKDYLPTSVGGINPPRSEPDPPAESPLHSRLSEMHQSLSGLISRLKSLRATIQA